MKAADNNIQPSLLLKAEDSVLICIDVQTKVSSAMNRSELVLSNGIKLIRGALELDVSVVTTEQYPKGLGPTVTEFLEYLPKDSIIEKSAFCAADESPFQDYMAQIAKKQAVVFGMEAHVCVLQTAVGLLEKGWQVFVVRDAVSSRTQENEQAGIERMSALGIQIVTTEMVLFEWMKDKNNPCFKSVQGLIK